MGTQKSRKFLLCCTIALFATAAFGQGIYMESNTSGGPLGDKVMPSKTFMMPKMFRQEGTNEVTIMRLDREKVYHLDPEKKTYSEMTFAELEEAAKKASAEMNSHMAEMQAKMKDMPEAQRQMMEKMMGGKIAGMMSEGKIEVSGPGEKKTISGYSCAKFAATKDGKDYVTIWATKDIKGFDVLRKDWEQFSSKMMSMVPNGKGLADAFKKVEGVAIQTDMAGITTLVTKVEQQSTPASQFEVPAGYTKVDSPLKQATAH